MTTHRFTATQHPSLFGGHEPVLTIEPGDTIITDTIDAYGMDKEGRQVATGDNPLTGPFAVRGAEPGDVLIVDLVRLTPSRATGRGEASLVAGVVDPSFIRELPPRVPATWRIDTVERTATLAEPATNLDITVPLRPMLGCLGVAPRHDQRIWSGTSGPHGGNMDFRGLTAGATVYLPVFVPGALLYLGDGHAAQSAGEIGGSGIETSMEVEVRVDRRKDLPIAWPRGKDAEWIWTIGNARPLEQAIQHATTEMLRCLQSEYALDLPSACMLLSVAAEYEVGNVCNPAFSVACKLPRSSLSNQIVQTIP
ncbi:MAG TPA: acetamidase/formamidase family protein [Thermoanaerobaculia bacterium]